MSQPPCNQQHQCHRQRQYLPMSSTNANVNTKQHHPRQPHYHQWHQQTLKSNTNYKHYHHDINKMLQLLHVWSREASCLPHGFSPYVHTYTDYYPICRVGNLLFVFGFRANRSVFDKKKRIALSLFFKERIALTTLLKRVTRAIYSCLLFKMSN